MLTLTRGLRQAIVLTIGGVRITVRIQDIDRGRVRLGITAPRDMPVHREEVQQRIDRGEPRHEAK